MIRYGKGKKLAEAVEELTALVEEQPELKLFLDSISQSERGIAR